MNTRMHVLTAAGILLAGGVLSAGTPAARADSETIVTQYHHARLPAHGDIHVIVNDQPIHFDTAGPIMINGSHVFVPIRGVFEQIGGNVDWQAAEQVVEGAKPGHMFRIKVGSNDALVNGTQTELTTPPQLIDGTTYVPLRFASEALGAKVRWDSDTNTVTIRTGEGDGSDVGADSTKSIEHIHDGDTTTTIIKKTDTP